MGEDSEDGDRSNPKRRKMNPSNREYVAQHGTTGTGSDPSHHKSASPSTGDANTKAAVTKPGAAAKERKRERDRLKALTFNKSSAALCGSEEDDEEELPSQVKFEKEPKQKFTRSPGPLKPELSKCNTNKIQAGTGLGLSQQKVVILDDSKASKPAASKVLQAARPISRDDYSNPYKTAHHSISRCLAYCGFKDSGDAFRYVLSPAFLPAFTKFVRVVEDRETGKIPSFASIVCFIDPKRRGTPKNRFDFDLDKAWEEYQTLTKYLYEPARMNDVCKLLAHCLYWLVHKGPKRVQKPDDTRELRLREKKRAEAVFGPIKDIPFSENIVVPGLRGLTAFWHERDDSRAERYHRAFQMMLILWHGVQKEKGSTLKEKWETFWQHGQRFANREIDPEKHAPYWMRNPERAQ